MVLKTLQPFFGDAMSEIGEGYGMLSFHVEKNSALELLAFLKNHEVLCFNFLTDLCGVHFPHAKSKFQVVYHLQSMTNNIRVRIKVDLHDDPPAMPTVTELWSTANWMERETYDFYGIHFGGHPNLKRILNVDDMPVFPMRKEYPLEDPTRDDKRDEMFGREENPYYKVLK